MVSQRASRWLAVVCTLAAASTVHAHDPAKVRQFMSTKADDVLLATNRGLIFGNLETRDFRLLCNEAYGAGTSDENVHFVRLPSGRLLLSTYDGLQYSDNKGCAWDEAPALVNISVPSLAQDPATPARVFVTTYKAPEDPMPGEGTVRVSSDGGETFSTLLMVGDEYLRDVTVLATNPPQIYLAGMALTKPVGHFIARSRDDGKTWERFPVALMMGELDVRLLAVNPQNPDEFLARASASEPSLGERLLWSNDGGKTIKALGKVATLSAALFSRDGTVAYVGGLEGLQRLAAPNREPVPVPDTARTTALAEEGGQLLVSGYYQGLTVGLDGVGSAAEPEPASFATWMKLNEVDQQAECSASVQRRCSTLWDDWSRENLGGLTSDAGIADASVPSVDAAITRDAGVLDAARQDGADADDDAPVAKKDSDSCSAAQGGLGNSALVPVLLLLCASWLRRRRRAR